jgi:hypothetical protein
MDAMISLEHLRRQEIFRILRRLLHEQHKEQQPPCHAYFLITAGTSTAERAKAHLLAFMQFLYVFLI